MASRPQVSELIQLFRPSANALLDLLRPQIDDSMLLELAQADYGYEVDQHLAPLVRLRDSGEIPPRRWEPLEVLHLVRWCEPGAADAKAERSGRRGHLLRAFACAALLRMAAEPDSDDDTTDTQIQLIESALALGPEITQAGAQLLAWWMLLIPEDDWDRLSFELGLLILVVALQPGDSADARVIWLAEYILEHNSRLEERVDDLLPREPGDSLLNCSLHTLKYDKWLSLVRKVLLEDAAHRSPALQKPLEEVALLVREAGAQT